MLAHIPRLPDRLSLHILIWIAWGVLLVIAAFYTIGICAMSGFSPDGALPGTDTRSGGWFLLKAFAFAALGSMVQFWWYSLPLVVLTFWEFRRCHPPRRKRVYDYDL